MPDGYTDIRALHPDYRLHECWHCGHAWYVRSKPQARCCSECLMGQHEVDSDASFVTERGTVDYGRLWYGDVPREEMRARYAETCEETRRRLLDRDRVEVPGSGYGPALAFAMGREE